MSNKEIKDQLQKGNVKFTVDGIISYMRGGKNNEWGNFPRILKVTEEAESIYVDEVWSISGMNVSKWGSTYVTLYTYNMLGKKSIGKIKYSDITIL
jgi:hypothetical protein|tara:strand:+ start:28 stop:315 length:288 start_codon:yes stop_codon:yes gene_type:complete